MQNKPLKGYGALPYQGIERRFSSEGTVYFEEIFINGGIPHGVAKRWHDSGQLTEETTWQDGQRQGVNRSWYENGQLTCAIPYQHNEQDELEQHSKTNPLKNFRNRSDAKKLP